MRTITVHPGEGSYEITIGGETLQSAGTVAARYCGVTGRVVVVTDDNVGALYGETLTRSLEAAGLRPHTVFIKPGEDSKTLAGLEALYDAFSAAKLGRDGLAIALGGGVVGDLTGFAAATYMRGISFMQIPTTLLAQVDSSVGGKTAVNLKSGKNLAGAFHRPKAVVIDTDTLDTLPERELRAGMAEVIKYGAIKSAEFFNRLQGTWETGKDEFEDIIAQCCLIKSGVVSRDEYDRGERALLNFGHTFGHAIEKRFGYERYNHGEAVAQGCVLAARAGEKLGVTEPGTAAGLEQVLKQHGLETDCACGEASELLTAMGSDKKANADTVSLVLLRRIGDAFTYPISFTELGGLLEEM